MPRKKSIKNAATNFQLSVDKITDFVNQTARNQSDEHISFIHDFAIIKIYREFEELMLQALIGAINNDTSVLRQKTGFDFPKHLTDEVCKYIILKNGYFDFKGRDGLIKTLKDYVPDTHFLLTIIKADKYKKTLNELAALRNFAAHGSEQSKKTILLALGIKRIHSCGAWLKTQGRLGKIISKLKELATEIKDQAPY